ncbi:MAG: rRNA methyltransferase, partial [Rhodothermales bacterium]|nr:rRNA methyltransferase [Rhodothermales bacterium]
MLETGDLAIDATAGNGFDTAFLAAAVGGSGRVVAFDVQKSALRSTAERLERLDLVDRVDLICASHARMAEHVDPAAGRAGVVMFNLGYLPGGADRSTRTRPPGTTAAIRAAMDLL